MRTEETRQQRVGVVLQKLYVLGEDLHQAQHLLLGGALDDVPLVTRVEEERAAATLAEHRKKTWPR